MLLPAHCLVVSLLIGLSDEARLTDYILDYQPVAYDPLALHCSHQRVRRSLDPHLTLRFSAYGRDFHLKLKRDNSIFAKDHMMKESDGFLTPVDTSFIYSGHLENPPGSFAHIAVINGTARGFVTIPGHTTYHIEPAAMYFPESGVPFHTVIYPESSMNLDPYRHKRSAGMCGNDLAHDWMKRHTDAYLHEEPALRAHRHQDRRHARHRDSSEADTHGRGSHSDANSRGSHSDAKSRGSHSDANSRGSHSDANSRGSHSDANSRGSHSDANSRGSQSGRARRSTIGERNTCYLYLLTDPVLWRHVKEDKYNTILTDSRTQQEILAFLASHVSAVKTIYASTTFTTYDRAMAYSGVDFVVKRTNITTPENMFCGTSRADILCQPNIDVANFLNIHSLAKHDEFCLAYAFTFRDFTGGTLGLAWAGSESKAAGGICERHKEYQENGSRVHKSLNTGIVTVVNYGEAVPAGVSQLTFAHEIGHSFGSPHDSGTSCVPYGTSRPDAEAGNYIMFAGAIRGDKPNNDHFSECSLDNITRVLDAVLHERYGKVNCFQKSTEAFCGNGITEGGEECDCGYEEDCQDGCCYGKGSTQSTECTLREGKICSPTAGPCCSADCEYIPPEAATVCQPQDDCKARSLCGYP